MKFETFVLRGLFFACFTVCALIMGAMLSASPSSAPLVSSHGVGALLTVAPSVCALPNDGVACLNTLALAP